MARDDFPRRVYRAVGGKIAAARRAATGRMTQQDLAELTEGRLSRSALANIERGRQRLSVHHLYLIARALGVGPESLLPAPDGLFGASEEVPQNAKVRDWLSKIARKPLGGTDAKTK